jgi:HSP20 family molecular chaperone IbpA
MLDWMDKDGITRRETWGLVPNIRVEDYVDDDVYVVRAEMPGVDPDKDVSLTVKDGALTIRGERREEQHDKNFHEFQYGSFARRIVLPSGAKADDVSASYADGVLEVRVPIPETDDDERPISIDRKPDAD